MILHCMAHVCIRLECLRQGSLGRQDRPCMCLACLELASAAFVFPTITINMTIRERILHASASQLG